MQDARKRGSPVGSVGDFFSKRARDIADAAADLAAEANLLIEKNKALAGIGFVINPAAFTGTYASTQAAPVAGAYIESLGTLRDIRWYYYLHTYALTAAVQKRQQELAEDARRKRNAVENAIDEQVAELNSTTANLVAEAATGELRLMTSRIAATFAGPGTFIVDGKPPEWRMYEQLYGIRLLDRDEWLRQTASLRQYPGMREARDAFLDAAEATRMRW